jgi:hypothetical protein
MAELYLHQRQIQSIFNLLGEKENDITFSLGWALSRSPSFLHRFLGCLLGASAVGLEEPTISLQEFSHGAGITDIEICSPNFHIIIEAKRGWALPSTEQLKKYLPRFEKSKSRVRLVVTMSECSQDYAREYLPTEVNGTQVRHVSWSELSSLTASLRFWAGGSLPLPCRFSSTNSSRRAADKPAPDLKSTRQHRLVETTTHSELNPVFVPGDVARQCGRQDRRVFEPAIPGHVFVNATTER